jgi:glutamine synthetase
MAMTRDAVLAALEEQKVNFLDLWFTDITGLVKSITRPASRVGEILDYGEHFDGSSIEGFAV